MGRTLGSLLLALLVTAVTANAQDTYNVVVHGRVVDERGAPIAGAAVAMTDSRDGVDTNEVLRAPDTRSDAGGAFRIEVPAERTGGKLVVTTEGRQCCARHVDASSVQDFGVAVLPRGAQLTGRLRDADGAPVAGATVQVTSAVRDMYGRSAHLLSGARSDERGIFTVPGVPATGLQLQVSAEGYRTEQRIVAQDAPLDLQLTPEMVVRGKIVDAGDHPLQRSVHAVGADGVMRGASSAYAKPDGAFTLQLPIDVGEFRLVAHLGGEVPEVRSELLRGEQQDVELRANERFVRQVTVRVRSRESGAPVDGFRIAFSPLELDNLQVMLAHTYWSTDTFDGETTFTWQRSWQHTLLVKAPGYAFAVTAMPDQPDEPMGVELDPEARIRGTVVDAATGAPMAGVPIGALPKGGSYGMLTSAHGLDVSDANGAFVIHCLQPGDYGVQAHADGRRSSLPIAAKATLEGGEPCKLTVPAPLALRLRLTGAPTQGPPAMLRLTTGENAQHGHDPGGFQHFVRLASAIPVHDGEVHVLEPLLAKTATVELYVPSRTRVGAGTTIPLGRFDCRDEPYDVAMTDLTHTILRGKIEPSQPIPMQFVHVIATRMRDGRPADDAHGRMPPVCGVASDGRFAIDLPVGDYRLRLLDVRTGVCFHTEDEDVVVPRDDVTLRPFVHLLDVRVVPEDASTSIGLGLPRPNKGMFDAFLRASGHNMGMDRSSVPCMAGTGRQRWMVPSGTIEVTVPRGGERKVTELQIERPVHEFVVELAERR